MEERLQKLISQAGLASRRKAEELIVSGSVTVNGQVATLGDKADPEKDEVRVNGKRLRFDERPRYIIMNKKRGIVSSTDDPEGRPTVISVLGKEITERLYPVGRLDIDSEGMVLLTNDGALANQLTHPRYGCEKTYKVAVEGQPREDTLERWRKGITLEDGDITTPCSVKVLDSGRHGTTLRIVMKEGKKRQIRRVAEQLGHPVTRLIRTHIGSLAMGNLKPGAYRELSLLEVRSLKDLAKPAPQRRKSSRPSPSALKRPRKKHE